MLIRALAPHEAAAVVDLWREAGLTRPWNDPDADLQRALAGPASTVLVGVEGVEGAEGEGRGDGDGGGDGIGGGGGAIVASAMVGHDGHRGWVYYLAVRSAARGGGRGRAMMRACEAWLAERRIAKLNLMVRGDNAAARAFYETLGYGLDDVLVLSRRLDG